MATSNKVVFAESAVAVHVALASEPSQLPGGNEVWAVESRVMHPGETLPLSAMPPYLSESVKNGEVPGLKVMTPAQAKRRADSYREMMGLGPSENLEDKEQEEESDLSAEEIE